VEPDDLLQRRVELLKKPVVARGRVIRANRLEIPERCVDGVVLGRLTGPRESVRKHPAVDEASERLEDAARDLRTTGRQREARQRDHRVAPPVAEPVISRDHCHPVGIGGERPPDDELVGGEHEVPDPPRCPRGRGLGAPPRLEDLGLVASTTVPGLLGVERRRGLSGQQQGQRRARFQGGVNGPGMEVIVHGVETALAFPRQLEALIPGMRSGLRPHRPGATGAWRRRRR
jgi:hypothetical protein